MFIANIAELSTDCYKCKHLMAKRLIKLGFYPVGIVDKVYYFENTENLNDAVNHAPCIMKWIGRAT
jgi:hypothetical protein